MRGQSDLREPNETGPHRVLYARSPPPPHVRGLSLDAGPSMIVGCPTQTNRCRSADDHFLAAIAPDQGNAWPFTVFLKSQGQAWEVDV